MIQRVKKPIQFFWSSFAIVIIVFAALLQLARWSLPYLTYFNDSLEKYASKQVNAQVSLGHISAKWTGLRPQVMVDDLSVESISGQPLLVINRASMKLDILLSLYRWTPVWHSVKAEGVRLHVSQDEAGGWSIGGLPSTPGDRNWRYRSPNALFLRAGDVKLESSKILFSLHNQRKIETDIPLISIQNNGHFHRLNAKAAIGDSSAFNFILEGVGDPSTPDQFFAQAYLQLNRFPVERLAQLFGQVAVGVEREGSASIAESEANLNMWLDFATPSRFLMNGHIELVNDDSSVFAKKYYLDIPVSADITGDYSIKTGLSVGLRDVQVDKTLALKQAKVVIHENQLKVAVDNIDLQPWIRWSEKRLIRSDKINSALTNLAPEGQINNLYSSIDLLAPARSELQANVSGVHTQAWRGLPEFKQVSGYIETSIENGFIVLDANNFSFFPEKAYAKPILTDYASGVVEWRLHHQNKRVNIDGYDLKMLGDYGEARGNFSLDLGWKGKGDTKNLILQFGLRNSNARFHQQLVPKLLPKDLLNWMGDSIKSGEVSQAGLLYRGGLNADSDRTVQFFADLEEGGLDFSSDWPALKNLTGHFVVDNNHISGNVSQASIYKGDQFKGDFAWNENNEKALVVQVAGTTNIPSGLQYLRESWLKTKVGNVIKQVSGEGRLDVGLDLTIPLSDSSVPSSQKVVVTFNKNKFSLHEAELTFDSVKGLLTYSTEKGFSSDELTAVLFNQPIIARVGGDSSFEDVLLITGGGAVDVKSVADWLQLPMLSYASGSMNYDMEIQLPINSSPFQPNLLITSDLVGVHTQFPEPFDKKSDQALPLKFTMPFYESVNEYKLTLGSYFSGHFVSKKDKPLVATVAVSDGQFLEVTTLPDSGIKLVSQFKRLDAKKWLNFIKAYPEDDGADSQAIDVFLSVDELMFNDYRFNDMIASGHREKNGWSFFVDNDDMLGGVYLDDDRRRPLMVDIDYLNWPLGALLSATSPPAIETAGNIEIVEPIKPAVLLKNIDPRELPLVDLKINSLIYSGKALGSWSMELRPDDEGLVVRNIIAAINGFTLAGDKENQGAILNWQAASAATPESTRFTGIIFGGNPKALFEQWDLPFGLESQKTNLAANLFWLGSPAEFSVDKLEGTVDSHHKKGIFVQEKTNNTAGVLRLFGLFNFDSWARRVRLDFSDVYKKGIVFDEVKGQLTFKKGIIDISEPIAMEGPASKMLLSGSINYPQQTVNAKLIATLPIGGNLTIVAALAGGLPVAAGVYLVTKLFKKQVERVSSVNYLIDGDWNDPVVRIEKLGGKKVTQPLTEGNPG